MAGEVCNCNKSNNNYEESVDFDNKMPEYLENKNNFKQEKPEPSILYDDPELEDYIHYPIIFENLPSNKSNNTVPNSVIPYNISIDKSVNIPENIKIRNFDSGATRDTDNGKFDIEGFLNPLVLKRYFEYMHKHRKLSTGELRDGDNWQKLFGEHHKDVCIKSLLRHSFDLWLHHRGYDEETTESLEDSICAILFNANAYLLKVLMDKKKNKSGD